MMNMMKMRKNNKLPHLKIKKILKKLIIIIKKIQIIKIEQKKILKKILSYMMKIYMEMTKKFRMIKQIIIKNNNKMKNKITKKISQII